MIAQKPVKGKDFFNREKELDQLLKERRNYALLGLRKSGKTSLLCEFNRRFEKKNYLISYIYILFEETFSSFVLKFSNIIIHDYLAQKNKILDFFEDSFDSFEELSEELIKERPELVSYLLKLKKKIRSADKEIIDMIFYLPQKLAEKENRHWIIELDEVQTLANFPFLLDILRKRIMQDNNTEYIISGSLIGSMKKIVKNGGSPLFGHFKILSIGNFSYQDGRKLFLSHLKGININESHLNFLLTLTGCFPFYLNVLSQRIRSLSQEKKLKTINKQIIIEALKEELFEPVGILYIYFEDSFEKILEKRKMGRYLQILKAISLGKKTATLITNYLNMPLTSIPKYLDFLIRTELISREEKGYKIKDKILEFWLKACYRIQESSILDIKQKLDYFEKQVHSLISSFKQELGKAREAQIREIFVRMGKFLEVKGGMLNNEEFDLICSNFLKKIKKVKEIEKLFLFSFFGINKKAQEIAKKSKIEVWDINKINKERKKFSLEAIKI